MPVCLSVGGLVQMIGLVFSLASGAFGWTGPEARLSMDAEAVRANRTWSQLSEETDLQRQDAESLVERRWGVVDESSSVSTKSETVPAQKSGSAGNEVAQGGTQRSHTTGKLKNRIRSGLSQLQESNSD